VEHVAGGHRALGGGEVVGGREAEAFLLRVAAEQDDFFDGERERELVALREIREVRGDRFARRARGVAAEYADRSVARRDEAGDRAEERGLACAVRPHDDDELATADFRVHVPYNIATAKLDGDVCKLQPGHAALLYGGRAGNAVPRDVRRRNNRVAMNLPVEVIVAGKKMRAVSQDLSPYGMFVRLAPPLDAGTLVQLVISPNGQRLVTTGQVTHALAEVEARTLGRYPGNGIVFRDPVRPADELFSQAVQRLLERHAHNQTANAIRIVVADKETRVLERLSTSLDNAGFSVATATNGMEAIGACLSRTPDVALVERDMPVVDGFHVLQEMGRHTDLASVPVIMMSAEATDLVRLQAFQLGASDFIPKPFTVLEVIIRARRAAKAGQRDTERVILRGTLAELGLPSLLTMFEQEKKSGQLSLIRDQMVAWIDFIEGKIVRARSTEIEADSQTVLMSLLDWQTGYFELSAGAASVQSDLDTTVTHLLMAHAQLRDESARS